MGTMILLVLSEEKGSVERVKMQQAQTIAGHQARSHAGISGTRPRSSSSSGAGRGLRQGCSDKIGSKKNLRTAVHFSPRLHSGQKSGPYSAALLHAIVRCFARDDDVVNVRFAKAGGGDANELCFLRKLF